jgi:hypothetical protein
MVLTEMKYPNMRKELIEYLEGLSDKQYQLDCWVNNQCPDGVEHDDFDLAVHFLFDDTLCAESPEKSVGVFLRNLEEAGAVKTVCDNIDQLLNKYGCNKTDDEYIQTTEWDNILISSSLALNLLISNDKNNK